MAGQAVAIADIVGVDIEPGGETPYADHLFASLMHISNARPFFLVLDLEKGKLVWTSGGSEFQEILSTFKDGATITSCQMLYEAFGFLSEDVVELLIGMDDLQPGEIMTSVIPIKGTDGKFFKLSNRRRNEPNAHQVQVSIHDITPFKEAMDRTRVMAVDLMAKLDTPIDGGKGVREWLLEAGGRLEQLFTLDDDDAIAQLTTTMSDEVTKVSERMVHILKNIEEHHTESHWQPFDVAPNLRPLIPVHAAPITQWDELQDSMLACVDGRLGVIDELVEPLTNAYQFVTNSESTFIISPEPGEIYVLNGEHKGKSFKTITELVNGIGVEANSMQTAINYFERLHDEPALSQFSVNDEIVQAWGRPGAYGGWQCNLMHGEGEGVDVRGMLHGIKNLILHLQVLYVIKNKSDVDEVREALSQSASAITARLDELGSIAATGNRAVQSRGETVCDWLTAAVHAAPLLTDSVQIHAEDGVEDIEFQVPPHEMEDTIGELVRNAFHHNATNVSIRAGVRGRHLEIQIDDDGSGIADDKLSHIRKVLNSGQYDPTLTTRAEGTGNGLLSAQASVQRLVDGMLEVSQGPGGKGARVRLSAKLPENASMPA